jgi:hypothetical protein
LNTFGIKNEDTVWLQSVIFLVRWERLIGFIVNMFSRWYHKDSYSFSSNTAYEESPWGIVLFLSPKAIVYTYFMPNSNRETVKTVVPR